MKDVQEWMHLAYRLALQSPDPSTQTAAIIVGDNDVILGSGCNTFPLNVSSHPERLERPVKYSYVEHAERNAVYDAARQGNSPYLATMYALWAACDDCARSIIQSGIKRVVTHSFYLEAENEKWDDKINHAMQMFKEAGVVVNYTSCPVGITETEPLLFNGKHVIF